jgi:hypothetical protein
VVESLRVVVKWRKLGFWGIPSKGIVELYYFPVLFASQMP